MNTKYIYTILLFLLITSCNINDKNEKSDSSLKQDKNKALSSIKLDIPIADITILGTFHFVANVDPYKRKYDLDVTSEKRQNELSQLTENLKKYKATKVLVEYPIAEQNYLDSLYQEYRKGNFVLEHSEAFQLGFRLAKLLNNEHIYAVDVQAPLDLEYPVDDWEGYAKETGQAEKLNYINSKFETFYGIMDSLKTTMPLVDYYAYLNSKETILANDQQKLDGWIEVGSADKYLGADLVMHDYRRNLRIYSNILSLIDNDDDRFLLIIGSSHTRILKHLFEDSIEFNYIDILDYL